jgi:NADPH:quinone reductase-like Zn-dependent oxidoreductase
MKAIVYTEYGPPEVLQLKEVAKPVPKANEVLIKVYATTVTTGDVNIRNFVFVPPGFRLLARLMFGVRGPKKHILGVELSGEVEAVGKDVTRFKRGDPVFGIDSNSLGAYAEYVCWPEKAALVLKPDNLSYAEAAAISFGAHTALVYLRDKAKIQKGQKILINGASGGVGTHAVQLARYYGAEVTGVCSTRNVEFVKSLGADHLIDYTREDFTRSDKTYDIILDTVGRTTFSGCKAVLKPNGLYLASGGGPRELGQALWTSMAGSQKVLAGPAPEHKEDLLFLKELIEAGKLKAVIDRSYPLEQIVEAHRYVDRGHKRGAVVITVGHIVE